MYKINKQTKSIKLIRGDSFAMPIRLWVTNPENPAERYQLKLSEGDRLTFTVKESAYHTENAVQKVYTSADCGTDGVIPIELAPEDTESLEFGGYRYDLELFFGGKTDTIVVSNFELAEEITGNDGSGDYDESSSVTVEVMPTEVIDFEVMPSTFSGEDGKSPYIGEDGYWYQYDDGEKQWINTGVTAQGEQGPAGAPGKDGADGAQGPQGVPGTDGKDGADGKDGEKGEKGDPGEPGEPGKDGADGKDGAPGADGKDAAVPTISPLLTLTVEGWTDNSQTVAVALDTTKRNVIDVVPESVEMWAKSGVYATAETAEGITFVCAEVPTAALLFRVTSEEVSYVS